MKNTVALVGSVLLCFSTGAFAQKKPAVSQAKSKYAALAIDRDKGYYYGFGFDQESREAAESVALEGAKKAGADNASIVLVWSGEACGAYHAVKEGDGTAYGWGVAKTRPEADAIAEKEANKRSNGEATPNNAWACNSKSNTMKVVYDASPEIFPTVKVKDQVWALPNLAVSKFRNGDPIYRTTTAAAFQQANQDGKPAYLCYRDELCQKYGYLYNGYAVVDPRGLAPAGWRIPTKEDWSHLVGNYGNLRTAGRHLRGTEDSPAYASKPTNMSGFSARMSGYRWTGSEKSMLERQGFSTYWSSTRAGDKSLVHFYHAVGSENYEEITIGTQPLSDGLPIRLIKE